MTGQWSDLAGQRFGRLVAVEWLPGENGRRGQWNCRCDCGSYTPVFAANLMRGKTRSCGCIRHGERFREERQDIKNRKGLCYNVRCPKRNNYRPTVWSCSHCKGCPDRKLKRGANEAEA